MILELANSYEGLWNHLINDQLIVHHLRHNGVR